MRMRILLMLGAVFLVMAGFTLWAVAGDGLIIIKDALPSSSRLQDRVAESETELATLRQEMKSYRQRMTRLDSEKSEVKKSHDDLANEIKLVT